MDKVKLVVGYVLPKPNENWLPSLVGAILDVVAAVQEETTGFRAIPQEKKDRLHYQFHYCCRHC